MRIDNPTFPVPHASSAADVPEVLLVDYSLNGDSSVDLTLPHGFRFFRLLIFNYVPQIDATSLFMRFSTDGGASFDAGASSYNWGYFRTAGAAAANDEDASDSEIDLCGVVANGSAAGENYNAEVLVFNHYQEAVKTIVYTHSSFVDSSGNQTCITGSGAYQSLAKINAVRLIQSSGNMASGRVQWWGVR